MANEIKRSIILQSLYGDFILSSIVISWNLNKNTDTISNNLRVSTIPNMLFCTMMKSSTAVNEIV